MKVFGFFRELVSYSTCRNIAARATLPLIAVRFWKLSRHYAASLHIAGTKYTRKSKKEHRGIKKELEERKNHGNDKTERLTTQAARKSLQLRFTFERQKHEAARLGARVS